MDNILKSLEGNRILVKHHLQDHINKKKLADAVAYDHTDDTYKKIDVNKEAGLISSDPTKLSVKVVMNTTNVIDSHMDLHMPGLWTKTVSDNNFFLHLQEHEMKFDKIITENATPSVVTMQWKKLGIDVDGKTQALIFTSEIDADRNSFMFDQYSKGYVKNHSVGMRYVPGKYLMCVNSTEKYWAEEKANWDKYISAAINPAAAEEKGFFYVVLEAKLIEGSAVVIGSNRITPTLTTTSKDEAAADHSTSDLDTNEPPKSTQDEKKVKPLDLNSMTLSLNKLIK